MERKETWCYQGRTKSMKIWYCHPTAGSPQEGMSYRPYYLGKYWQQQGLEPYIISSSFHHLLQVPQKQHVAVKQCMIDGLPYIRLKTLSYQKNNYRRMLSMFGYALGFITKIKKIFAITGRPDVIVVSSTHPFHYFPLYYLAKKLKIPLIFEVRDLWPSSLIELLGLKSWHPLVILLSFIERHAYRHANKVISLLALAKEYMCTQGLKPSKFHYIPNGCDLNATTITDSLPASYQAIINKIRKQKGFIVAYLGAMGPPNALIHLVEAIKLLSQPHPDIHCILIGKGEEKAKLKALAQGFDNLHFLDPIPKTTVPALLEQIDLAYLGWQDTTLYQYGVSPNKIFDYMLAAKPILESGGAPQSMLDHGNFGWRCAPANPTAIAAKIAEIAKLPPLMLKQHGQIAREYVTTHHDYQKLAEAYANIFREICSQSKSTC